MRPSTAPITLTVAVPPDVIHDRAAELALVAIALDSEHGAQLAGQRIRGEVFFDPGLAKLFAAAIEVVGNVGRVHKAAALAGVDPIWAADVAEAPRRVFRDVHGYYPARVRAAHERRSEVNEHLDALRALGAIA